MCPNADALAYRNASDGIQECRLQIFAFTGRVFELLLKEDKASGL